MQHEAIDYRTPFDELAAQEDCPDTRGELCVAAVVRLCDWVARHPECWATAKVWLTNPDTSQKEISRLFGITQATVSRRIRTIRQVIMDSSGENAAIGSEDFYSR